MALWLVDTAGCSVQPDLLDCSNLLGAVMKFEVSEVIYAIIMVLLTAYIAQKLLFISAALQTIGG